MRAPGSIFCTGLRPNLSIAARLVVATALAAIVALPGALASLTLLHSTMLVPIPPVAESGAFGTAVAHWQGPNGVLRAVVAAPFDGSGSLTYYANIEG